MIQKHSLVKLSYDLYIAGVELGTEELIERTKDDTPLTYCQGLGMMIPAFEAALEHKSAGDTFDFTITAAEAYGEHDEQGVMTLPRSVFCIDGVFDEKRVKEGNIIPMNTTDGQTIRAQVVAITEENVTIDLNHPLAGEDLHFTGKIIEERPATEEEIDSFLHPKCGGCNKGEDCASGCSGCSN